ncbi:unnamed protein product [Sphagnum tenellum]
MLQDFSSSRSSTWQEANTRTDTSSRNLVGMPEEDEDFQVEIPDMKMDKEMQWHLMRQAHREFGETMGQAAIDVPHRVEDEETRRLDIWQD